jgi:hypothetical protein
MDLLGKPVLKDDKEKMKNPLKILQYSKFYQRSQCRQHWAYSEHAWLRQ